MADAAMAEAAAAAAAGGAGGGGGGAAAEHARQVTVPGEGGLPKVVVRHHSGAEAEVYLHGATVTSYKGAAGQQLLFVSSRAVFDGVKAIRGGIPIVFPQFGAGALPQHGFARNKTWTLVSTGDGAAELTLADDDATRAVWPHAFKLTYRIAFDGYSLTTTLEVMNPKGAAAGFAFDALLHTYLFTGEDSVAGVRVHGLRGTRYISKPDGGAIFDEVGDDVVLAGEVDRVYMDVPKDSRVVVRGITSGASFNTVTISRVASVKDAPPALRAHALHAPTDVVVWNAGAARCATIADFGPGDYKHYVCVEPGRVSAETAGIPGSDSRLLEPGRVWSLKQIISVSHVA